MPINKYILLFSLMIMLLLNAFNMQQLYASHDNNYTKLEVDRESPLCVLIRLKFVATQGSSENDLFFAFADFLTEDPDFAYDGLKFSGNPNFSISSFHQNQEYSVLALPVPQSDRAIPIKIFSTSSAPVLFKLEEMANFPSEWKVSMKDNATSDTTSITLDETISLASNGDYSLIIGVDNPIETGPLLTASTPKDNAINVSINENIELEFCEQIVFGSGHITLVDLDDGTGNTIIDASNPLTEALISDKTLTINPNSDLEENTNYAVLLDSGAILDLVGESYLGIADSTTFNFKTVDSINPFLISSSPSDNETGVSLDVSIQLTFSESIEFGTGTIQIRNLTTGVVSASIEGANPPTNVSISNTILDINLDPELEENTDYAINISPNAIKDLSGKFYNGISDNTTLNFSTRFNPSPTLLSSNPLDDAIDVSTSTNIELTFSEEISLGSGVLQLIDVDDGSGTITIDVEDPSTILELTNDVLTINPSISLEEQTNYALLIAEGSIKDLEGKSFAGITDNTTLNFKTADETNPALVSTSPSDNQMDVATSITLTFVFNEAIQFGSGTIEIIDLDDPTSSQSLEVSTINASVSISGSTLSILLNLEEQTNYAVQIGTNAIRDLSDNNFTGILDNTTLNFKTADETKPVLVSSFPNDNDLNVATNTTITLIFSENIQLNTGSIELVDLDDNTDSRTFDVTSSDSQISIVGNIFTFNLSSVLESETNYALRVSSGAILDLEGNAFAGITDNITLNFKTADETRPVLVSSIPTDNSQDIPLNSSIELTFSEAILFTSGTLQLVHLDDGSSSLSFTTDDIAGQITILNQQVIINPSSDLEENTNYAILISTDAIEDLSNNQFIGISDNTTLNFKTADLTAPIVTINSISTEDTTPPLSGTVNDVTALVEVTVNGQTISAINNQNGTWKLADNSVLPLPVGIYNVEVTATDPSGNIGTDSTSDELEVTDTIPPTITVNVLVTNDQTPALSGNINDPTASISVMVDGQSVTAQNNGDGTWTVPNNILATISVGIYNVVATATDNANNTGTDTSTDELEIDLTIPTVSINTLNTTDQTPELTGSIDDLTAVIRVEVGGQTVTAQNNMNGTWTLADNVLAVLSGGTYDVVVTATDLAGNQGKDASIDELNITDLTPPFVTIDFLITNDQTPALSGTVDDDQAIINISLDGQNITASFNSGGVWILVDNSLLSLTEGIYDISVTATDNSGNVGVDTTTNELTIDITPPVVTVSRLISTDQTPAINGTIDDNDAIITVIIDGQTYTAINNRNGTWTLPDNTLEKLEGGVYDITVTATDVAGNVRSDTTTDELEITDRTAPKITVDRKRTNDPTPEITGTIDDAKASLVLIVESQQFTIDNDGSGTWKLNDDRIQALSDGTYDVKATATDVAGNIGQDRSTAELVIDLTSPNITVDALTTNNPSPQLTGTVDDENVIIKVVVDSQSFTAMNTGEGRWELPADIIIPLLDGLYDVVATAEDDLGNIGTDSTFNELLIDTSAPMVSVTSVVTNDTSPALQGTANEPLATVLVTVNGQKVEAINQGNGTWRVENDVLDELSEGIYNVSVEGIDLAGNVGTDTTTDELTIDITPPTITSIERWTPNSQNTDANVLVFLVTFSELVTGVESTDFTPRGTTAQVSSVEKISSSSFEVRLSGGDLPELTGIVGLEFNEATIFDIAGNTLLKGTPAIDEIYSLLNNAPIDTIRPFTLSFERKTPLKQETDADRLVFLATFSEPVIDVDDEDFIVPGTTAIIEVAQETDSTFNIILQGGDLASYNGVVALNLNASLITDLSGNLLPLVEPPIDETYILTNKNTDSQPPTAVSFSRKQPLEQQTNADTLVYLVQFSEPVIKVDISDFKVSGTSATFEVIRLTDTTFEITIKGGDLAELNGTVGLDFSNNPTVTDLEGNILIENEPSIDEVYVLRNEVIDIIAPKTIRITRKAPLEETTDADVVTFQIVYSENVIGVDAFDFTIIGTTADISVVSVSASVYDVTVQGGDLSDLNATVQLKYNSPSITDLVGNPLSPEEPSNYESYILKNEIEDTTPPSVISFTRKSPLEQLTDADQLSFLVIFSEDVVGVDNADFEVVGTTASKVVTSISASIYEIVIQGGDLEDLNGNVSLNLDNPTITDLAANNLLNEDPLVDEAFIVENIIPDTVPPTTLSFTRSEPLEQVTNADELTFLVTFSEGVLGVDPSDFKVSGIIADLQLVQVTSSTFNVLLTGENLIDFNGTIGLDFNNSTITDSTGNVLPNVEPAIDETYILNNLRISIDDVTVLEGNVGITNANISVRLNVPSSQSITVNYTTQNGSAKLEDLDYEATQGVIEFEPGEVEKSIELKIFGDIFFEEDEEFFIELSNPMNASLIKDEGRVLISNDDENIGGCFVTVDNGIITITFNNKVLGEAQVSLFDISGKSIVKPTQFSILKNKISFKHQLFVPQIYILIVETKEGVCTHKVYLN